MEGQQARVLSIPAVTNRGAALKRHYRFQEKLRQVQKSFVSGERVFDGNEWKSKSRLAQGGPISSIGTQQ
jgi:hypothetical protein